MVNRHALTIGLAAGLIVLAVFNIWFASNIGDPYGEFLGVTLTALGVILVVRQIGWWRQDIADRAARDQYFKSVDAQPSLRSPLPPAPGTPQQSMAPSGSTVGAGGSTETHELQRCPFCGTFEPREGSAFCRGCGRPVSIPAP